MYRPVSPQPSSLLQHQPQRYSDRHLQQTSSSDKRQILGPFKPQVHADPENSLQPNDATRAINRDDDQGIKSYLKKTNHNDPVREPKPDKNTQVDKLKGNEKQSL